MKLANAPQVTSKMLSKNTIVGNSRAYGRDATKGNIKEQVYYSQDGTRKPVAPVQEISILLKLLPYFDVPFNSKTKEDPEAAVLRKMLGVSKVETDMMEKRMGIKTML